MILLNGVNTSPRSIPILINACAGAALLSDPDAGMYPATIRNLKTMRGNDVV